MTFWSSCQNFLRNIFRLRRQLSAASFETRHILQTKCLTYLNWVSGKKATLLVFCNQFLCFCGKKLYLSGKILINYKSAELSHRKQRKSTNVFQKKNATINVSETADKSSYLFTPKRVIFSKDLPLRPCQSENPYTLRKLIILNYCFNNIIKSRTGVPSLHLFHVSMF